MVNDANALENVAPTKALAGPDRARRLVRRRSKSESSLYQTLINNGRGPA
jgi:hypothetical protein